MENGYEAITFLYLYHASCTYVSLRGAGLCTFRLLARFNITLRRKSLPCAVLESLFRLRVYHYTLVYGSDKGASQMLHTPLIVYLTPCAELGDAPANIVLNSSFFVYLVRYLGGERIKLSLKARFLIKKKKKNRRNFIASL